MLKMRSIKELVEENERLKDELECTKKNYKMELYRNEMWRETILMVALDGLIDFDAQRKIYDVHNGFMETVYNKILMD